MAVVAYREELEAQGYRLCYCGEWVVGLHRACLALAEAIRTRRAPRLECRDLIKMRYCQYFTNAHRDTSSWWTGYLGLACIRSARTQLVEADA